ncbi:MAG: UPF0147 family protein [Candidatus Micrarchaeaceae archaeon]
MKENKKLEEIKKQVEQQIGMLLNDTTVPRNVKNALEEAKKALGEDKDEYTVRFSNAIYKIDEVSNDINLSPYARSIIWNILSLLESGKE